jgi:hypothetical protein
MTTAPEPVALRGPEGGIAPARGPFMTARVWIVATGNGNPGPRLPSGGATAPHGAAQRSVDPLDVVPWAGVEHPADQLVGRRRRRCPRILDRRADLATRLGQFLGSRSQDSGAGTGYRKRRTPAAARGSSDGASRTRTGDLLGAIQGAHHVKLTILQGYWGMTGRPACRKSFAVCGNSRVLARGGVRVAKAPDGTESGRSAA